MAPRTYPEIFRVIAQVRFSGFKHLKIAFLTALNFDQQYSRLRAIFFQSIGNNKKVKIDIGPPAPFIR